MTHDIYVTIYSAYRPGLPGRRGPDGLPSYCGVAGVSGISTRPEFFGLQGHLAANDVNVCIDKEVGGIGIPPYRKRVTIELPDGIAYGEYTFANLKMYGLHATANSCDGMGPCVGVSCAKTIVFDDEDWEAAIDKAISSGILLSVPQNDGSRAEIKASVVAVSDIFRDRIGDWDPAPGEEPEELEP